jgi:AMIN domain-containing protein
LPRARAQLCVLVVAALTAVSAAQNPRPSKAGTGHPRQSPSAGEVNSVTVLGGDDGPILAISSSRPLTPKLQTVEGPLRLVIDLPGSMQATVRKRIPFRNEQIKGIRINQYQSEPPVTRIVVDLAGPVRYTWDALGNRLNIRIRTDESATATPASVPAFTAGEQPVAVPYAEGSGGTLVEAGSRVASGASITAKEETAILRLTRGGEVRVCPGTTVSVATSPTGKDLLLGMSSGAMETHYRLEESSDSVLTPDFRIVFPGPGEFDFAISADAHGNTCVSSMPGSTSSVVVAELLGNGTYEIKPSQEVLFRQGRLDMLGNPTGPCGCPARQEPVLRASAENGPVVPGEQAPTKLQVGSSSDPQPKTEASATTTSPNSGTDGPETQPVPQTKSGEMKVQVEAPLVFSGRERAQTKVTAPPAKVQEAAALPMSSKQADPLPAVVVLPPVAPKPKNKGFFGRVKGFFGSIF